MLRWSSRMTARPLLEEDWVAWSMRSRTCLRAGDILRDILLVGLPYMESALWFIS